MFPFIRMVRGLNPKAECPGHRQLKMKMPGRIEREAAALIQESLTESIVVDE